MKNLNKKMLSDRQRNDLIETLKTRFETNMKRHKGLSWNKVLSRLESSPEKLWALNEMEKSGGEPDVVGHDKKTGEFIFYDCTTESPKGRRSICYDGKALAERKEHKPKDSAIEMSIAMGVEILTEEEYLELQKLGEFDTKTSSWIMTPNEFRKLGGALTGERRYERVFIGHNGAQSYYAARGFRGVLKV